MSRNKFGKKSNGEGTIWQNASGTWTAQVTKPTGGRMSKTFPTQRETREWVTAQTREFDTGDWIEPSAMTLGNWWYAWIKIYKGATNIQNKELTNQKRFESSLVSKSSISSYEQSFKRISKYCPELFSVRLTDLRRSVIQMSVNKLADQYSDDTVRQTYIHINDALSCAVEDKLIAKNPCTKISMPNRRDPDSGASGMSEEDYDAFVTFCLSPPRLTNKGIPDKRDTQRQVYKIAALTSLAIATRRGETCGLKWSDLRPEGISIERSLSNLNDITGPKNEQSAAVIPVAQEILDLINKLPRICEYIFAGPNGRPICPSTLYHWMASHSAQVCSRQYTFHELRHTMISRAAKAGVNPKVLQTITRHKRLDTLLNVYTHVDESQRRQAIEAVNPLSCKCVANLTPKTDPPEK